MLKEDSDQHRKIGESYRLMFLEEKKKTKELTAENQTLKEVDRICNNNDEVNSEATTETSVQHSLKRARDFNQAVIKEEKHRGDDELTLNDFEKTAHEKSYRVVIFQSC